MKIDPIEGLIDDAVARLEDVSRRRMFGCAAYFAAGEMFAVVWRGSIVLKLAAPDRAEALGLDGASPFEPRKGMRMRELVVLPGEILDDAETLADWCARSHRFAAARGRLKR